MAGASLAQVVHGLGTLIICPLGGSNSRYSAVPLRLWFSSGTAAPWGTSRAGGADAVCLPPPYIRGVVPHFPSAAPGVRVPSVASAVAAVILPTGALPQKTIPGAIPSVPVALGPQTFLSTALQLLQSYCLPATATPNARAGAGLPGGCAGHALVWVGAALGGVHWHVLLPVPLQGTELVSGVLEPLARGDRRLAPATQMC